MYNNVILIYFYTSMIVSPNLRSSKGRLIKASEATIINTVEDVVVSKQMLMIPNRRHSEL